MTDLVTPPSPSADQTVGYLLHISETVGEIRGMLATQNETTRGVIVRVDAHDVRLGGHDQAIAGAVRRLGDLEETRRQTADDAKAATTQRRAQGWQVKLALIGTGFTLAATAAVEVARTLGAHLPH